VTIEDAVASLMNELKLLGAVRGSVVLSSNVPPRNALGTPRNDGFNVSDPGVAVWWVDRKHGERVIACDKWNSVRENVRALGLAVAGLRAIDRAGASQILDRAFTAFGALPPSSEAKPTRQWWEVFGFPQDATKWLTLAVLEARYRELASKAHPDRGGSDAEMVELNNARAQARAHFGEG
jgi:hypothetical protein